MSAAEHFAQQRFRQSMIDRNKGGEDKIGNAEVDAEQVMDADDLYDHETLAINRLMATITENIGKQREGSALQREVRERFAEIGFVVRCDLWKDDDDPRSWDERPWWPIITLLGRTEEQGEFDHDRMGHEVRSNILGKKDQDNVQKTTIGQAGFEAKTASGLILPK